MKANRNKNSQFLRKIFGQAVTAVLGMLAVTGTVQATVLLTDSAVQTVTGQDFTFTFSPVERSDGSDGLFTIHARGDYSATYGTNEWITWSLEGLVSDSAGPYLGSPVIQTYNGNDLEWAETYTISGSVLRSITNDSVVTISADLGSYVDMGLSANPFVEVELAYTPVPEPATLTLLALGSSAWLIRRRKMNRQV